MATFLGNRRTRAHRAGAALVGLAALLLTGCGGGSPDAPASGDAAASEPASAQVPPGEGRIVEEVVSTPSLANNIVEDPAERDIIVYLPPSYDTAPDARFPVVYFLAGAGEDVGRIGQYADAIWEAMLVEGSQEFIVVEVDGQSAAMRSNFYTNSPIAGNAEDALTRDLVAYIDATYRTVPEASARGLSGFSMGGSATINSGLRHPDIYSALFAFSPGLFAEGTGLQGLLDTEGAWRAYGAAFSPDPTVEYPYQFALQTGVPLAEQDPAVVAAWESGYGNLRQKLADYLAQPVRLTAIRISFGTADSYPWIPEGCEYFLGLLDENGVPATSYVFGGGHDVDASTFATEYVAFFSEHLEG